MNERDELFAVCLTDHRGVILKVARSFTTEPSDLDDLVQDVLLRLWSSLDGFRGDSKLSTWVYRVALNRALTWKRDEAKHRRDRADSAELIDRSGMDRADDAERLNRLYEHIRTLTEIDRALVLLSLDGFSYAEMAEVTGISESNVGARLSRARSKLQRQLQEEAS